MNATFSNSPMDNSCMRLVVLRASAYAPLCFGSSLHNANAQDLGVVSPASDRSGTAPGGLRTALRNQRSMKDCINEDVRRLRVSRFHTTQCYFFDNHDSSGILSRLLGHGLSTDTKNRGSPSPQICVRHLRSASPIKLK